MSLILEHNYEEHLSMAKHINLRSTKVQPPYGALGDISIIPEQTIPPINTVTLFSSTLPVFELKKHIGLAALDHTKLPENFNWRHNGGQNSQLISKPGNQMLCGSCWAISTAGIVRGECFEPLVRKLKKFHFSESRGAKIYIQLLRTIGYSGMTRKTEAFLAFGKVILRTAASSAFVSVIRMLGKVL